MLTIDRWLRWRPFNEWSDESLGHEPPKPPKPAFEGLEGSISQEMSNLIDAHDPVASSKTSEPDTIPPHDPDAWRADFGRWLAENCIHREGREDSAGIGCLWVDFCEWAITDDSVPCTRLTFEHLLEDAGFRCADGMAAGLLLESPLRLSERASGQQDSSTATLIAAQAKVRNPANKRERRDDRGSISDIAPKV